MQSSGYHLMDRLGPLEWMADGYLMDHLVHPSWHLCSLNDGPPYHAGEGSQARAMSLQYGPPPTVLHPSYAPTSAVAGPPQLPSSAIDPMLVPLPPQHTLEILELHHCHSLVDKTGGSHHTVSRGCSKAKGKQHMCEPEPVRTYKSLKAKFKQLVQTSKPISDADCPPAVERVHYIDDLINDKVHSHDLDDDEIATEQDADHSILSLMPSKLTPSYLLPQFMLSVLVDRMLLTSWRLSIAIRMHSSMLIMQNIKWKYHACSMILVDEAGLTLAIAAIPHLTIIQYRPLIIIAMPLSPCLVKPSSLPLTVTAITSAMLMELAQHSGHSLMKLTISSTLIVLIITCIQQAHSLHVATIHLYTLPFVMLANIMMGLRTLPALLDSQKAALAEQQELER
ncbi:uncharacterized protein LAESUDRAFT_714995 [Laetiporus sulphureus 93-53]|uniref:Uncharacterized protein n=1 Tax=Laetiporus sulphureus 93-53 TaxID=1314785 RepID=A0A165DRS9_9APHY|nr:uncharacterized protein LAESUDRAFT_714995 [Laetiporus sulphureus 93-53]KZT05495.1 hypothetical protein LAESUDRAFT_714995 [Laetiporus sulphureus 93-53]